MPSSKLVHPTCAIPIGDIDIGRAINKTAMSCAERGRSDRLGIQIIIGPLGLVRIVAEKGDRRVVAIEYSHATFEFRDDGVVAMKRRLARTAKVLRDRVDVLSVEIEVTQPAIFAIANEKQRLVVTRVESDSVTAVKQPRRRAFAGVASEIVPIAIKMKDPRIAVSICDKDRAVRRRNSSGDPPLVR